MAVGQRLGCVLVQRNIGFAVIGFAVRRNIRVRSEVVGAYGVVGTIFQAASG
jgi:uncharacterized membrane protein (Fun14 family)